MIIVLAKNSKSHLISKVIINLIYALSVGLNWIIHGINSYSNFILYKNNICSIFFINYYYINI